MSLEAFFRAAFGVRTFVLCCLPKGSTRFFCRANVEPLVLRSRGRIFKLMGDGFLVEFASSVDAVECAMSWHAGASAHEADRSLDTAILFRIGINIGDVIVEGDDVHGDKDCLNQSYHDGFGLMKSIDVSEPVDGQ
jgi:hypothetical protein